MHVENELAEIITTGDHELEEIVHEEVLEPPLTDSADTTPAQGKPWCITLILNNHWIYIYVICIYVTGLLLKLHA